MRRFLISAFLLISFALFAQDAAIDKNIPKNAKVFVAPMNGFETYIVDALSKKKVPVEVVANREAAEFEITGTSESKKAGVAKILLTGSWHSKETASVTVSNLKTGIAVWAYSYHTYDSVHGKQSSAESCAKHLKEKIESGK
jgi:hypothetical protein